MWPVSVTGVRTEAACKGPQSPARRWECDAGRQRRARRAQNDLQAMARCHRIGQAKDVTIYRLVSRDTYEQNVFDCASRKQGAPAWRAWTCCSWLSLFGRLYALCACTSDREGGGLGTCTHCGTRISNTSRMRSAHADTTHAQSGRCLPQNRDACVHVHTVEMCAVRAQGWTTPSWAASTRRASARTPSASPSCCGMARTRSAPRRSALWQRAQTSPARRARQRCATTLHVALHWLCRLCLSRVARHTAHSCAGSRVSEQLPIVVLERAVKHQLHLQLSIHHMSIAVLKRSCEAPAFSTSDSCSGRPYDRTQCCGRTSMPSWQGAPRSVRSAAPPATRSAPPHLPLSPRCAPNRALSHLLPLHGSCMRWLLTCMTPLCVCCPLGNPSPSRGCGVLSSPCRAMVNTPCHATMCHSRGSLAQVHRKCCTVDLRRMAVTHGAGTRRPRRASTSARTGPPSCPARWPTMMRRCRSLALQLATDGVHGS